MERGLAVIFSAEQSDWFGVTVQLHRCSQKLSKAEREERRAAEAAGRRAGAEGSGVEKEQGREPQRRQERLGFSHTHTTHTHTHQFTEASDKRRGERRDGLLDNKRRR